MAHLKRCWIRESYRLEYPNFTELASRCPLLEQDLPHGVTDINIAGLLEGSLSLVVALSVIFGISGGRAGAVKGGLCV